MHTEALWRRAARRERGHASGAGEGGHVTANTTAKKKTPFSLSLASARPDRTHTSKENCPCLLRCCWCFPVNSQSRGRGEGGCAGHVSGSSDGHERKKLDGARTRYGDGGGEVRTTSKAERWGNQGRKGKTIHGLQRTRKVQRERRKKRNNLARK